MKSKLNHMVSSLEEDSLGSGLNRSIEFNDIIVTTSMIIIISLIDSFSFEYKWYMEVV